MKPISIVNRPLGALSDEEQIEMLIKAEGETAERGDTKGHISLFDQHAIMASRHRKWVGCQQIAQRDISLFTSTRYGNIRHDDPEITIVDDRYAEATSNFQGRVEDLRPGAKPPRRTESGKEEWTFTKGDDLIWRISSLVYD